MAEHEPSGRGGEARLDAIVARFLASVESGEPLDRQALLREHPEFTEELRLFFADHDRLQNAVAQRPTWNLAPTDDSLAAGVRAIDETLPTHGLQPVDSTFTLTDANRRFGDYELLDEIDRGGMGVIYRARHLRLNRIVALKMIKSGQLASDEEIQRFHAEAEAAAALDHPGIVPVYEAGEIGGLHYFSMAFVEGKSLASLVEQGPLPPRDAAAIVKKTAQAVAYAHAYGVIHRDLKPGKYPARRPRRAEDHRLRTREEPAPASQVDHDGPDPRHTLLHGSGTSAHGRPRDHGGRRHLRDRRPCCTHSAPAGLPMRPPPRSTCCCKSWSESRRHRAGSIGRCHGELEQICLKCLEKKPADRYGSAAAVAADLDRFLKGEPVEGCRRHVARRPASVVSPRARPRGSSERHLHRAVHPVRRPSHPGHGLLVLRPTRQHAARLVGSLLGNAKTGRSLGYERRDPGAVGFA